VLGRAMRSVCLLAFPCGVLRPGHQRRFPLKCLAKTDQPLRSSALAGSSYKVSGPGASLGGARRAGHHSPERRQVISPDPQRVELVRIEAVRRLSC
jgi:hypothetical protein